MLGRISTVTITTPDLPATVAAYQKYLGYRVVEDGALARDVARSWGRAQLAGQRCLLMEAESGAETWLRFVQGPAYVGYEPLTCVGWNAAGLIVRDVDELAARLAGSPFQILGAPVDILSKGRTRAMQVVGPAREVLRLTQVKKRHAAFDIPEAACDVDRAFVAMVGGEDLDVLQDYYHRQFGVPRAAVMPSAVSVLSLRYGLPREYRHPIAALKLAGQCYIEAARMPPAAALRPCDPGQLPPGIAMISFEIERLPEPLPSALGPMQVVPGLPYAGRRARTCVGATGELVELIEVD